MLVHETVRQDLKIAAAQQNFEATGSDVTPPPESTASYIQRPSCCNTYVIDLN